MKKSLLLLSSILLLAGAREIRAERIWLLNLTDKPQSFTYLQSTFVGGVNGWTRKSFNNIPARSKSNGHELGIRGVCLTFAGWKCLGLDRGRGPWTVVISKGDIPGTIKTTKIRGSIYKSKAVKDLIQKARGKGDPKKLINNWE